MHTYIHACMHTYIHTYIHSSYIVLSGVYIFHTEVILYTNNLLFTLIQPASTNITASRQSIWEPAGRLSVRAAGWPSFCPL